jgi:hypothetical protein
MKSYESNRRERCLFFEPKTRTHQPYTIYCHRQCHTHLSSTPVDTHRALRPTSWIGKN